MAGLIPVIVEGIVGGATSAVTEHVLNHMGDHHQPDLNPGPSYIPPIDPSHFDQPHHDTNTVIDSHTQFVLPNHADGSGGMCTNMELNPDLLSGGINW